MIKKKSERPIVESSIDPADLWREAQERQREVYEIEERAIRAALEQATGFVARAAEILKINRTTLQAMLEKGRHAELGKAAARMREATGYRGGNPTLSSK